jgi:hypothetical protein
MISAAATQLSCPLMALMITSRRVFARASRHTCRSIFSIVRHYRSWRTCLNVYDPDISYVYDMTPVVACPSGSRDVIRFGTRRRPRLTPPRTKLLDYAGRTRDTFISPDRQNFVEFRNGFQIHAAHRNCAPQKATARHLQALFASRLPTLAPTETNCGAHFRTIGAH